MRIGLALLLATLSSFAFGQEGKWPDVALNGRIVNVMHEGVPAAEVWVTDVAGERVARTFADGDGYYQLRRLPNGALRLHARGDDVVESSIKVASAGFVREATLTLQDAGPLRGVVTWADGTPVIGANLIVYDPQSLAEPFHWQGETKADKTGAWQFAAAPLRPLKVVAFVPGHELGDLSISRDRTQPVKVVMPTGRTKARTVRVTGAPDGLQVLARCVLTSRRNTLLVPRSAREVRVDADGLAKVWMLPMQHQIRIRAPGYRSMPIAIPCSPGVERQLQFALSRVPPEVATPRTTITGQVVDELGRAIADVTVVAIESVLRSPPCVSDEQGCFTIEVPAAEKVLYKIGLLSREWRLGDSRCEVGLDGITWQSMAAKASVPVRLHATRASILRGTLLGPTGTPLAAAQVALEMPSKRRRATRIISATDAAGRIDIAGIPAGHYTMTTTSATGLTGLLAFDLEAGQETAPGKLEFDPGGEVRGRVTDASGKPAASVAVSVSVDGRRLPRNRLVRMRMAQGGARVVMTDSLGRFRLPMVRDGHWVAYVWGLQNIRNGVIANTFTVAGKRVNLDLRTK